ncbi:MAG: alkaline phosphatase family protein [Holophagaceae bacterium]|nr:alkaline phosphatase family protein [Holophagaceae bacterium]
MRPALPAALLAAPLLLAGPATSAARPPRPGLLLVISVDQLSADLLERYGKHLPGGLGLLQREGVHFTAAYHDHAYTETGPGHSVLLSGRHPSHTGIPENNWKDPATGRKLNCVEDAKSPIFGKSAATRGASQALFRGTTLGDWLQAAVKGSRVFTVSGKDRASILMGGSRPTAAYWFESGVGYTTSAAYGTKLPDWLAAHNAALMKRLRNDTFWWTPMASSIGVARNGTYTTNLGTFRSGLPRQVNPGGMPLDEAFYNRFKGSPFFDEATAEAAQKLLDAEKVGQGDAMDLLAVGFSATDYVGHFYGTAGDEMVDQIRRLDALLDRFLAYVRARVPSMAVVLTADHGSADLMERLAEQGFAARRLDSKAWLEQLNAALRKKLPIQADAVSYTSLPKNLYVKEVPGATKEELVREALALIRKMPEIALALTPAELEAVEEDPEPNPEGRSLRVLLKHSYVPGRSGDILVVPKPFTIFSDDPPWIVGHGYPYDSDRRVPLIFWGPWEAGVRREPVRTVDLAPTLALELDLAPLEPLDGRPLDLPRKAK